MIKSESEILSKFLGEVFYPFADPLLFSLPPLFSLLLLIMTPVLNSLGHSNFLHFLPLFGTQQLGTLAYSLWSLFAEAINLLEIAGVLTLAGFPLGPRGSLFPRRHLRDTLFYQRHSFGGHLHDLRSHLFVHLLILGVAVIETVGMLNCRIQNFFNLIQPTKNHSLSKGPC